MILGDDSDIATFIRHPQLQSKLWFVWHAVASRSSIIPFECIQSLWHTRRGKLFVHRALDMPPPNMLFSTPASLYLDFPQLIGTYLCLYMCIICRFIVMKNKTKKYINRIGQNTGISKTEKNVMTIEVNVPLVHANQNLNSGKRRAKGRYSLPSFSVVGRPGLSLGSSNGDKNAIKLFRRKIPRPYATMKYPWT